jgi:SAM-dependent methyltransferase
MELAMPAALTAGQTGVTDPIHYYMRPGIVGWMFRRRIAMGLEMIPPLPAQAAALEVGYGSGLVLYNLASRVSDLHGLDLDADPDIVQTRLRPLGVNAKLVRGSVLDMAEFYADATFDLVVCFSTMEHIADPLRALREMLRVLKPGGVLLIGMPAVNRFMEFAFQAIGFRGIEDHHITTPGQVWRLLRTLAGGIPPARRSLPGGVPLAAGLYHTFRLHKGAA